MANLNTTKISSRKSIQQESFGLMLHTVRLSLLRRTKSMFTSIGIDLNPTQFRVLGALSLFKSMSATELARSVEYDGGALTRMLDLLQGKGYVAKRTNVADRRAIEVFLTDEGRAAFNLMRDGVTQINSEILDVLNDAEQTQLFTLMRRICDRLDTQSSN